MIRQLCAYTIAAAVFLSGPTLAFAAGAGPTGPVPRWPMIALGLFMMIAGLGAGAVWRAFSERGAAGRVQFIAGVCVATLGAFGVAMGTTAAPPLYSTDEGLPWIKDLEKAEQRARAQDRVMMVDFTAEWCNACHELEAQVFMQPKVAERLRREVVLAKVDFDAAVEQQDAMLQRFEVSGLPRVAFVSPQGELLRGASFEGKLTPERFEQCLDAALSGSGGGENRFSRTLREDGLWAALLLMFVAGFLASLTPCVYPLIPITIGIFGARGASSRLEALSLSATYVLGIAVTYSALGVAAASFGGIFGAAMQHVAVKVGLAALFVVLALSSLGVFTLRLPGDLQTRLNEVGGAGYLGALLMGLVAGIIAAPCVGPIVAGVLLYVAEQQDPLLGWLMLFVFALGLGLIFLVLGTFSSLVGKLPKSGPWMDGVKAFFAAIFLAMALYYARYVFPVLGDGVAWIWSELGQWLA